MATKVIFRKEKNGEVLAVFPEFPGDNNPYRTCACYSHIGQHGAMALDYIKSTSELKYRMDYQDLYDELVSVGYDLEVVTRISRKMLQTRIANTA